jgi:hypothetical protein
MAARFCLQTHVYCPAAGAPLLTIEGGNRDSLHAAVAANPSLWSVTPPVSGQGHVNPSLFQYLAAHIAGPEL